MMELVEFGLRLISNHFRGRKGINMENNNKKLIIKCVKGSSNTFLIIIIGLLIVMGVTNPTKQEYASWAKEQLMESSKDKLEQGLIGIMAQPLIENMTVQHNYILFSVFETKNGKEEYTTIGILKNFIPIPEVTNLIEMDR